MSSSLADTVVYQYDDLNRLIRIEYSDGAVIEYTYNAAGNRLSGQMSPPPDNISPIVTIASPNGGIDTTTAQSLITISGITSDTGWGVATVYINTGQENTGDTANFSFLVELEPDTNIFIVTATDNAGNTGTDTIAIIYNAAPILSPIGDQIVDEGDTLTFAITASDSNSQDLLTYSVSNLPQGASFDTSTQVFTWVTDYDDSGIYANIVFTVNDGRGSSDSETISITVNNVNRPPVLAPIGDKSVNEGDTLTFEITASDSDTEDTISYTAQPLPDGASFGNPTFTWTPGYDQAGTYPVTFIATDTQGDSDSETIIITVNNVNQPPVLDLIADITVNEAQTITIIPTASDPDGDSLAFSYSGWMSADTYTTTYDDAGTYTVMVTVSDGELSDSQAVTITVNNVNRCPILAEIGNRSVNEGNLLTIDLTCSDSDNDPLVFSIEGLPAGATFIDNGDTTATFAWTPDYGDSGNYGVTFKVSDGACTDQERIVISVGDVNRAPVLDPIGNQTVNEGELFQFTITAADPDGDSLLTCSASNLPSGASFDSATQVFSWSPGFDQAGNYSNVLFEVTDNGTAPLSDSETITITVTDANRCPVLAEIGNKTVNEGQTLTFSLVASDSDGEEALSFTHSDLPSGAAFVNQVFGWTPKYDQAGSYSLTFYVSDGICSDSETISLTVNNTNLCPILSQIGGVSIQEGDTLTLSIIASDSDGDTISCLATGLPQGAVLEDCILTWGTNYTDSGTYEVTIEVSDGICSDSEVITVTVGNVNQPPVLDPIAGITVNEGEAVTIIPTASDPDEDSLTFSCSGWMSADTYTTAYNDAGTHTVIVTVSDGQLSDSCEVTITVADVLSTNITKPTQGGRLSGNAVIIEAATQAEGITGIDFYRKYSDSDTWTMIGSGTAQSSRYRAYWNADSLEDGDYSLKAVTKSDKGNLDQAPPEITVAIDHQSPDYVQGWAKTDEESILTKAGECILTIPAGAVDTDTVVRLSTPATIPPQNLAPAGLYIEVTIENGQTQLNSPATISFGYNEENGIVVGTNIHEENLKIYLYGGSSWQELPTTVDVLNNIATATTDHFTIFGLFGTPAPNLTRVIVYPNPFKPYDGNDDTGKPYNGLPNTGITFGNLTAEVTIQIFDLSGNLVREERVLNQASYQWDAKNGEGEEVASGVYIYLITNSSGKKASGKLGIVR